MDDALRKARVVLDALLDEHGGPSFEAWLREGESWNGWACPHFERGEADRVLATELAAGYVGSYDAERDAYVFPYGFDDPDYDPTDPAWQGEEPLVFPGQQLEGHTVYPIGAWTWTWRLGEKAPLSAPPLP